jgi:hypothetical protein
MEPGQHNPTTIQDKPKDAAHKLAQPRPTYRFTIMLRRDDIIVFLWPFYSATPTKPPHRRHY